MPKYVAAPAAALLAMAVSAGAALGQTAGPMVAVTGGQVQGMIKDGGAVFKGLPFAAPPVGDLRWKEPQAVKAWSGVKPAGQYGSACAQAVAGWNKTATDNMSEDCLYLNVWNSEWPAKTRKPVMLWIHGGANSGGSAVGAGSIEPPFDGASLARKGVVVVTINYRLGVFGFVGHPELTAESPHKASGGYGVLDQVAALKWVRENIAKFGGDPANVTVFGQSAGAQDTTILVASPLTRGLMHKAIVESGSPMIGDRKLLTPPQTAQLGVILATALKAPATDQVKYLRSLPTEAVLASLPEFRKGMVDAKLNMDVAMDGYAVPEFSPSVYAAGRQARIPMIIGNNGRDSPGARPANSPEEAAAAVKAKVAQIYAAYPDLAARATAGYARPPAYPSYGPIEVVANVDYSFRCTGAAVARWQSAVAPTFQYEFNAGNAKHPPTHSAELDFVFGYLRDQSEEPVLAKLSEQMQTYWTNFAKTGDPNGAGLPRWPRYDAARRDFIDFTNTGPQIKNDLRGEICPVYFEKISRDLAARS